MLAARRKSDARQLKGNIATKKRSKLDTNDGSPQKGNAAKKKRGKLGAGHKAAGKGTANLGCTLLFVLLLRSDLNRHSNLHITRNTAYY